MEFLSTKALAEVLSVFSLCNTGEAEQYSKPVAVTRDFLIGKMKKIMFYGDECENGD